MAKTKTPDTEIAVEAAQATAPEAAAAVQTADVTQAAEPSLSGDAEAAPTVSDVAAEAPAAADAAAADGGEQMAEAMPNESGDAAQVGPASIEDPGAPKQHLSRDEVEAFGLDPFVYGYGASAS